MRFFRSYSNGYSKGYVGFACIVGAIALIIIKQTASKGEFYRYVFLGCVALAIVWKLHKTNETDGIELSDTKFVHCNFGHKFEYDYEDVKTIVLVDKAIRSGLLTIKLKANITVDGQKIKQQLKSIFIYKEFDYYVDDEFLRKTESETFHRKYRKGQIGELPYDPELLALFLSENPNIQILGEIPEKYVVTPVFNDAGVKRK